MAQGIKYKQSSCRKKIQKRKRKRENKKREIAMMKNKESVSAEARPTITLPPRPSMEAFFTGASGGGTSPGPMTLVSNFFDNYPDSNYHSFSQLLAGAMASPLPLTGRPTSFPDNSSEETGSEDVLNNNLGFRQSKPMNLVVARSPLITIPPGLSPSGLLNSPGFFLPQSPFGMSHQQALAQVTAQAALAQSNTHVQVDSQPSAASDPREPLACYPICASSEASEQQFATPAPGNTKMESSEVAHGNRKYQSASVLPVDKSADDGYNWRKYGQKQVKGSLYPRSYYKCTNLKCPVKKKVERAHDGQITEIIYKGQHNHDVPQPNKRAKDSGDLAGNTKTQAKPNFNSQKLSENVPAHLVGERNLITTQQVPGLLHGSSDSEEAGDAYIKENDGDADEPNPKRRNVELESSELPLSHKTITEPKIIVQTRSEVDLLDDGYRWRKYGQKVVKGNPHPRSYYKCTSAGCNVRKHVERASTDPKAVITTYEGKHNHDVPVARNSGHSTNAIPLKPLKVISEKYPSEKHPLLKDMDFENNVQRPAVLRLKEEQIRV